jgi:SAM-dependent methyltransferase
MDPLAGSPWSEPATVAGFARGLPNDVLMRFAATLFTPGARGLDLGCGAARNAVPLALAGWDVVGTDLSWPMLVGAATRAAVEGVTARVHPVLAPMERLPFRDAVFDLVIAHGIWNLAKSAAEFRGGVAEAARVLKPGGALFVFTFSRHTLPVRAKPVAGEEFVYTQFSGQRQCFLTEAQLAGELRAHGFVPDARVPLTEYNRRVGGVVSGGGPVIYEAAFLRSAE